MNDADIELLLYRVLSGKILFTYKNEQYEVKSASIDTRYEAQILYDNIINDEKYNDWIREEDLEHMLISLNLWSKDTHKIIKDIEKKIDRTKVDMFLSSALSDKVKKLKKSLVEYKNQLNKIMEHRINLFSHTLEGYALGIKNEHLLCNTLFKNNNRVFPKQITSDQASYVYFNDLVTEVNKQNLSMDSYKKLARSGLWRSYWNCNKEKVFSKAVCDWTDDQRTVVSVTRMYDNIYDHPDCPSDNIIEDDDMLDGWMIHQREKNQKAKKQAQIDEMNPKLKNAQEVFLLPQSKEEIEEIIGLNSPESLRKMKEKMNYVQQFGSVDEGNLPDVRMDLMNRASQSRKDRK
jgi:hypothetical protein